MYRNVPQQAYEIQEMTETRPKEQNGAARNGAKPKKGTLTRKQRLYDSDSSDNGLIDDDDDLPDYEVAKGEKIRNAIICVVVLLVVVAAVIAIAVTLSGKRGNSESLGSLAPSHINYTHTVFVNCTPARGIIQDDAYIFRGIPYASAKRWKESETLSSTPEACYVDDIFDADDYGPKCYQFEERYQDYAGQEDCLFINVWTPSLSNQSSLPVMVYFHGGGLMVGSGGEPGASPNGRLATDTNMVYVSFNYRLSAFGFMSLDILGKKEDKTQGLQGNYGLQDQIMALKWVQQNIPLFGGNPDQVTVFGQGSGATSILALMTVPETRGLYHRAWLMSASPKFEGNTRDDVKEQNLRFVNNTRCVMDSVTEAEMLTCLEDTPAATVVRALPWSGWLNPHFHGLPQDGEENAILAIIDGKLVTKSVIQAFKDKTVVDVPLLIGNMAQEVDDEPLPRNVSKWTWREYNDYIKMKLPSYYQDVSGYYPQEHSPEYQLTSMVSDMRAICPMDQVAKVAANFMTSKVYRYVMSYLPTKNATMQNNTRNYAFSGLDMYAFFGSYDKISGYASVADSKLTTYMRQIVTKFVRDGQIQDPAWESFKLSKTTVITNTHTTLVPNYRYDVCQYWRNNGLFPQYAWMN